MKTGTLRAIVADLRSLKFNIKSSVMHAVNNYMIARERNISKIYFGCGADYREGWLNLDVTSNADYWIDLRNRININNDRVDFIMSSHTVEHLEHTDLVFHLKECFRLLKPNGVLRIGFPDFPSVIRNYGSEKFLDENRRYVPSSFFDGIPDDLICYIDLINRSFYEGGSHKIVLDFQKMTNLLLFAGFTRENISEDSYVENLDCKDREGTTLYITATK